MVKETKDLSLDPKWSKTMVVLSYINQVISVKFFSLLIAYVGIDESATESVIYF